MNKRLAILLGICIGLFLLIVASFQAWQWKVIRETENRVSAPLPEIKDGVIRASKETRNQLWRDRFEPLEPSDLIVLPVQDETGLHSEWNYELRNYPAHLLRALTFLGGRPLQCPEAWPLAAALDARDIHFMAVPRCSTDELTTLGRELKTDKIVQIVITREEGGTVASATGVDLETGLLLGPWKARVESERRSYESLFTVQTALCVEMAKDLCGLSEEDLFRPSEGDPDTLEAIARIDDLLDPPTFPRLMKAYRLAVETIEKNPRCVKAWTRASLASTGLTRTASPSESQSWREMLLRSLVAGEIALRLNASDPDARFAHSDAIISSGRIAEGLRIVAEDRKVHPDDAIGAAWDEALWGKSLIIDASQSSGPIPERILATYLKRIDDRDGLISKVKEYLEREPLAPELWACLQGEEGLNERRRCNVYVTIQGAAIGYSELIRQLELAGDAEMARQRAREFLQVIDIDPNLIPDNLLPSILLPEILDEWAREFSVEHISWDEFSWHEKCLAYRILESYSNARKALPKNMLTFDSRCASEHGLSLSPRQWIELAEIYAIEGAVDVINDIGFRYTDPGQAEKAALDLERFFPENQRVLCKLVHVYYDLVFTPHKVDFYRSRSLQIDFTYDRLRRIEALHACNKDKEAGFRKLEELKYLGPFSDANLSYATEQFLTRMDFRKAADFYELRSFRDPRDPGA